MRTFMTSKDAQTREYGEEGSAMMRQEAMWGRRRTDIGRRTLLRAGEETSEPNEEEEEAQE